MTEACPPPQLPDGWRLVESRGGDDVLVAVSHEGEGFYADIRDMSPAADLLTFQIRAGLHPGDKNQLTPITAVSDGVEAASILESVIARAHQVIQADSSTTRLRDVIEETVVQHQPKNDDVKRGHSAESSLEGYPIAVGGFPSTICPVSGEAIYESPIKTPRVTCYASGSTQLGWSPHGVFHSEAEIGSITDVAEKFERIAHDHQRTEVLLSGLARTETFTRERAANSSDAGEGKRLVLEQLAVVDEV